MYTCISSVYSIPYSMHSREAHRFVTTNPTNRFFPHLLLVQLFSCTLSCFFFLRAGSGLCVGWSWTWKPTHTHSLVAPKVNVLSVPPHHIIHIKQDLGNILWGSSVAYSGFFFDYATHCTWARKPTKRNLCGVANGIYTTMCVCFFFCWLNKIMFYDLFFARATAGCAEPQPWVISLDECWIET